MKELSIERKAKAYDEALKKARNIVNSINVGLIGKDSFEAVFPELKKGEESEDEKIRKHLITLFKNDYGKNSTARFAGIKVKDIIVWLEKQGEQKSKNESTDTCDSLIIKSKEFPASEKRDFGYFSEPADKVESKFHKGDWITDGISKCQIRFIDDAQYYYSENCILGSIESVDKRYHLWTIQDAKDGDVLIDKSNGREYPFIFKETKPSDIKTDCLNPLTVLGYCGIGGAGFTKGSGWGDTANCIYYPATKEQRDALMRAMADAGWEFDFDNKELKKINQEYTPKHKVGDTIYYNSFGEVKSMIVANVVTDSTDNPMYEDENGSAVFEEDLIEQKSAWSEEDEQNLNEALSYIKDDALKEFIKSLRPQPKQEWNKDDECTYKSIIYSFKHNYPLNKIQQEFIRTLKDRVQPQNFTVTDEEFAQAKKNAYNDALDKIEYHSGEPTFDDGWHAAIDCILKNSIIPQTTWKPSDEQMVNLRHAFNGGPYRALSLMELYQDLKKLREESL